ncbi:hypothetical protein ACFX5Q_32665 [Mesorhizobium sp. IMUNJ 23033]
MTTIGTFSRTAKGFSGSVKTPNLNVKTVTFAPAEGDFSLIWSRRAAD